MVAGQKWPAVEPVVLWVKRLGEGGVGVVQIDGTPYLVQSQHKGAATLGYRLTNCLSGKVYDVMSDRHGLACDCPDAMFRQRPGGCKHTKAMATVGQ